MRIVKRRVLEGIVWHLRLLGTASPELLEQIGTDPSRIEATAERSDGGFVINAEKWFVTSGDIATVLVVMANLVDGPDRLPTLFVVDKDRPGVEVVDDPDFTHSYPDRHPTIRFTDVEVGPEDFIGEIGAGDDLQRSWFSEERLGIAARGVGAMWRLLDETVDWATAREQGGERIYDYQGVSFPLADSMTELLAARLLTYHAAHELDANPSPSVAHGKVAMAKLHASEAANRIADRVLQVFGGRGYMTEHPVERHFRELRVDRIWEGTSEIQRVIIARGIFKRGIAPYLD